MGMGAHVEGENAVARQHRRARRRWPGGAQTLPRPDAALAGSARVAPAPPPAPSHGEAVEAGEPSSEVSRSPITSCATVRFRPRPPARRPRRGGGPADPRLVFHLDDVVAQGEDEVGAAQELALHLAARPLDAPDGERMLLSRSPLAIVVEAKGSPCRSRPRGEDRDSQAHRGRPDTATGRRASRSTAAARSQAPPAPGEAGGRRESAERPRSRGRGRRLPGDRDAPAPEVRSARPERLCQVNPATALVLSEEAEEVGAA